MGAGMARNLAASGLPLTVWNRTRDKAEAVAGPGITVADDPAAAVAEADVVITMLFDGDSVLRTLEEARPGLREGAVLVQMSTVGVEGEQHISELAGRLGLGYLDAPVLGTKKPAQDGTLVVLASGPDELLERAQPVFDAVGARTLRAGPAGTGTRLKLAANAYVLAVLEGVSESLSLAGRLGLDPALFLAAVEGGAMDSPYVQLKGRGMVTEDFPPAFALAGALKDADLILAAAAEVSVPMGVTRVVRDHLGRAADAGHGALDMSALHLGLQQEIDERRR